MDFRQARSFFTVLLGMTAGAAFAQGDVPAEIPPASYTGKQYVDSRGCVYVRAGISGNTVWVPRVTRQRQQICGMQPTFGTQARAPEPPAVVEPAPVIAAPARSVPTAPARPQVSADPGEPIATVASPTVAPQRGVTARTTERVRTVQVKPAPRRTVAVAPVAKRPAQKKAPQAPAREVTNIYGERPACQGGTAVSTRYVNSGRLAPVRCGPQSEAYVTVETGAVASQRVARATAKTVVRPVQIKTPKGYRRAWEDGRLNPHRGPRTATGDAQMELVWTNTVPRRLVKSYRTQDLAERAALEQPTTRQRAKAKKKTVRVTSRQRLSAMNAPAPRKQAQTARKASHRFVQVGTFGVEQNALNTARRLQSSGLPVRLSKVSKGGKTYTIVLAGPFGTQSQLNVGLSTARKAGFKDSFLRK